ncbi:endocuticle structural glycoprotein SgAbd-2-like [Neocloeon triangulifer]|uniref:endocuticle structural glycoprotein SgAbd-2-like n=1 Tax=Neocloeon triangulifer TaxID=2078957 RepID=UPI00286ED3D8|nr:endocuticle structural glycoprotein SgAbd-2-like [Neocloeon triangulifer]
MHLNPCISHTVNMHSWKFVFVAMVASVASGQHHGGGGGGYDGQYKQPPVNILSHKQALGHDGSFKYSFAADNGLQQGESIAPDGSRVGSYSYVDPKGKTITVHYTADKNGFHVQGDHLPKPVQPIHPVPATPQAAHQPYQQYQPAQTYNHGAPYYQAAASSHDDGDDGDYQEDKYNDPSKPHSFGDGYSFQFGG